MDKKPLTLREQQLEYFDILRELDRYCTENNIRYYIGCGTLIGAIRHKGFIPWDDDLDVFIPRPDYIRLCNEYESDEYNFRNIFNDKAHPYNFGRLYSKKVYSLFGGKKVFNLGIDIYVINGAPSLREEQIMFMDEALAHVDRAGKLLRLRNGLVRRKLWPFKTLDFPLMNRELLKAEHVFERYDFEKSEYIWPWGGGRLILKKELYGTPQRLQFEGGMFFAPEHYHEVLTLGYGDYMKLPPEEKRHPYHGGSNYWK